MVMFRLSLRLGNIVDWLKRKTNVTADIPSLFTIKHNLLLTLSAFCLIAYQHNFT